MSAYLLDTHVVVWLASEPRRVPRHVKSRLIEADILHVSAASGYEIAQKVRLGRMPAGASLLARWSELIDAMMAEELPLGAAEMMRAGAMPWDHRDPFDRMLVAQAQVHGLQLVTKDQLLLRYAEAPSVPWA